METLIQLNSRNSFERSIDEVSIFSAGGPQGSLLQSSTHPTPPSSLIRLLYAIVVLIASIMITQGVKNGISGHGNSSMFITNRPGVDSQLQ